ncbi:hypothetical protein [Paenibacillus sp. FSL H8-0034]|uniref:hypothetical protein n=1 Tax=Paenibacillus sp. FSL H8-0034 TaxID=2954671 RepID=UPI0030F872B9
MNTRMLYESREETIGGVFWVAVLFYTIVSCFLGVLLYIGVTRWFRINHTHFQYIHENLVIFILTCIAIMLITSFEFVDVSQMNVIIQLVYVILVFISLIFLVVQIIRFSASRSSFESLIFIPQTLFILVIIGLGFVAAVIEILNRSNETAFYVIIFFLIVYSFLLVEEFRLLTGTGTTRVPAIWRFVLSTFCIYILLNGFILITFGYFNLKYNLASFSLDANKANIAQTMLAGGSFFFQFPSLEQDQIMNNSEVTLYASILQYFIGLFVNILILPFCISFFSSRMTSSNIQNTLLLELDNTEYNNIGEGI